MSTNNLQLKEIADLNDELLLPWLDLYETAFPPGERLLISTQIKILKEKANGEAQNQFLYAALDSKGEFAGMLEFEFVQDAPAVFLWYMAVQPNLRGNGIGSWIYQQFTQKLIPPGIKALIFEVEIPERAESEEHQHLSERRIAFYKSQGAKLLDGIEYHQYIGWHHPPTPMHIMVHPLTPMEAQQAFDLAEKIFQDAIQEIGHLALR